MRPPPSAAIAPDAGEAACGAQEMLTLTIDGMTTRAPRGVSVMTAAARAGVSIPSLCASPSLAPMGGCRLCLVEIEGRPGAPASCTTPVQEGMAVRTQSAALTRLRHGVMALYLSDHPKDCLTCAANGDCALQDAAAAVGLRTIGYPTQAPTDAAPHMPPRAARPDRSNPYFTFDPATCVMCHKCVRVCEEVQGSFALTVTGRGWSSSIAPGGPDFLHSECVSCGACVAACPTAALMENSVVDGGAPTRSVATTCAYCGVGCSFDAQMKGARVARMVPRADGAANAGHSCVKGRFAFTYATHKDRVVRPMVRAHIDDPWRETDWDGAIAHAAAAFKHIQARDGRLAVGAITSSRCTNEEVFLVQKLVRTAFGNNNVDTCARVCHAPTGYGLKTAFGTSAGTQDFQSVDSADVILLIGANPTDGHPVFAARLKKRLRRGAKLIVIDPRRIDLVRAPHVEAAYHLPVRPGANVALLNGLAHVIVTEGLVDEAAVRARCDGAAYAAWAQFIAAPRHAPEATFVHTGVDPQTVRAAARLYATGGDGAIYYGLGVTEHSQGSTTVMAIANLAMATGNIGRAGVGVSPLRGQNNVQGACDMGSFPHELSGYRHVGDAATRAPFEAEWGVRLDPEPGLRLPNMLDEALLGRFKGLYIQGEDIAQSDPNTQHVTDGLRAMDCVVTQDLFLNETARYAHVFLPGASFLEKDGTFTNAERRINRVRAALAPLSGLDEWRVTAALSAALGYRMAYNHPSQIMDEIARLTPGFAGVSYATLDRLGSVQWPCDAAAPNGTPLMHVGQFARGRGRFMITEYVATDERAGPRFPLLLTTGRSLTQYNVGAQTGRTANVVWHDADVLEIHPFDADHRGVRTGDLVALESRSGAIALRAALSDRVPPGVVYTTFHHAATGANVVTTDYSDWATNCPEYKVTAVQVRATNHASAWQDDHRAQAAAQRIVAPATDGADRGGV